METEKDGYTTLSKNIRYNFSKEDTDFGTYHTAVIGFLHYEVKSYARSKENALVLALEALARKIKEE